MKTVIPLTGLLILAAAIGPAFAGPYYARGEFYAGTGETWGCDAGNEMFDDGLHGDGAAGDGVYGADVTADQGPGAFWWKIGTDDWSEDYPHHPAYPMANAVLYLMKAGETIHFRLDTNTVGDGWQPATNAVACDHYGIPLPGYEFELIGSGPDLGDWTTGIPLAMEETPWSARVTIATPGVYEYKYRVIGTWDYCNFGVHYNMFLGDNFVFETTEPQTALKFEFNPVDGRSRAVVDVVATEPTDWGKVKALYR